MEFFRQMNIATSCRATLYTFQASYINLVICGYWTRMQNALFERFRGQPINITGDGQYDSPGFTGISYIFFKAFLKRILDMMKNQQKIIIVLH
jgi:hypothetical protein